MGDPKGAGPGATTELRLRADLEVETASVGWRLTGLEVLGGGLEFLVFAASVEGFGRVALRVPRVRWIHNDNDPDMDPFELLEQEAGLFRHVGAAGLPVPRVHLLHRGERCDFLATELVLHDGSAPPGRELGRLTRRLHGLPAPGLAPVVDTYDSIPETLAERVVRRAAVVERITGRELGLPGADELRDVLTWSGAERRLLHMDLRPENVLTRGGRIVALLDWSNALLGDPALELARLSEYGGLDEEFRQGYGEPDPLARPPRATEIVYRLDSAVMLAVVFLSEAPDRELAAKQVPRVRQLAKELGDEL